MEILNFYFNFKGYITRKQFWLYYILPSVIVGFFGGVIAYSLQHSSGLNAGNIKVIIQLLVLIISFPICAKRLRDAGFSPWWTLFNIVPVLGGLIMIIMCGFFPTTYDAWLAKNGNNDIETLESEYEEVEEKS